MKSAISLDRKCTIDDLVEFENFPFGVPVFNNVVQDA